jgi:hypothetical protein
MGDRAGAVPGADAGVPTRFCAVAVEEMKISSRTRAGSAGRIMGIVILSVNLMHR